MIFIYLTGKTLQFDNTPAREVMAKKVLPNIVGVDAKWLNL